MISIEFPKKLHEILKRESKKKGITENELILEALSEFLNLDPEERAKLHSSLSEKYLKEAEELLNKKDYVQASEKAWGAASQIVKAVAAKKGVELRSHGELHRFVAEISKRNDEIRKLWQSAGMIHQNFTRTAS